MPSLGVRLGLGGLSVGLALTLGRCGGPSAGLAYAEDALVAADEPALVLLDDGQDSAEPDDDADVVEPVALADEGESEGDEQESTDEGPLAEPEGGAEMSEPEPEPESGETEVQAEPEPEGETSTVAQDLEQVALTADELHAELEPVVELLGLCGGCLGVILGYLAMSQLWGVLGGEQ